MKWYINSDRDLENLKTTCITYGSGNNIPFEETQIYMAMDSCKSLQIPDDLMGAIVNEPWEYRSRWLKDVNRVASKFRRKGLLIIDRLLKGE